MKTFFILSLLLLNQAYSEEVIVVSAEKMATSIDETSGNVDVITSEDLKDLGVRTLYDALRSIPGVSVYNQGGAVGTTTIRIRGYDSKHTAVRIDGQKVHDAMSTSRSFIFNRVSVHNIERIEVIRGSQGVIHGADAIGGVINIITKKSVKGAKELGVGILAGSHSTFGGEANYTSSNQRYAIDYVRSEGFSTANAIGAPDDDGYRQLNGSLYLQKEVGNKGMLSFQSRYQQDYYEFDGGISSDDPDASGETKNLYNLLKYEGEYGINKPTLSIAFNRLNRRISDTTTASRAAFFLSNYWSVALDNVIKYHKNLSLVTGIEIEEDIGRSKSKEQERNYSWSYYFNHLSKINDLVFSAGVRFLTNEFYGTHQTVKTGAKYFISKDFYLNGNYGTGFQPPSLYNSFDTTYGNSALTPETSSSYDLGFGHNLNKNINYDVNFFSSVINDEIFYNTTTSKYGNRTGTLKTKGVEAKAGYKFSNLYGSLSYTYIESFSYSNRKQRLRVPKTSISADVNYKVDNFHVGIEGYHRGDVDDYNASFQQVGNEGYTLFHLNTNYTWNNYDFSLKVENLLNTAYEEALGYSPTPRSFYGQVKATF